jgi:Ca2+/H+ antiporter
MKTTFLGGLKYKEQKFNPVAAGVSSVMLIVSVAGEFIFTDIYLFELN